MFLYGVKIPAVINMETIRQYSIHFDDPPKKTRPASRGLIIENGKVLLTYEKNTDVYMSPGGGREGNETFEDCCIRELREESGYDVIPYEPFLIISEYCFDTCYEAHYFLCEIKGRGQQSLTPDEIEHGACPVWLEINEAIEIFSHYDEKTEDLRSLYMREFTVLNKYLEYEKRKILASFFLGKTVDIKIDRPKGYVKQGNGYQMTYPVNYGYIPDVFSQDGEELDVYLLGVNTPVEEYKAKIIGIAHRRNDNEDKLIAIPEGMNFTKEEIEKLIHFQEQYFDTVIEVVK